MKKRWTEEEEDKLKFIYKTHTNEELEEIFGRSIGTIANKACILKICKKEKRPEVKEGFKYCPKCKEILPKENFSKNKKTKDGLQSYCKICKRIYEKTKENNEVYDRSKIIEEYRQKEKDTIFFCKQCNKEKTLMDYIIGIRKNKIRKECKECSQRHNEKYKIKLIKSGVTKQWRT